MHLHAHVEESTVIEKPAKKEPKKRERKPKNAPKANAAESHHETETEGEGLANGKEETKGYISLFIIKVIGFFKQKRAN